MINLRTRTEFSFGETFAPLQSVVDHLKAMGCTAAAITDFGSTWGHVKWHDACVKADIRPILGVELVVNDEDFYSTKMVLLAKNATGLEELYRLSSLAHRQPQPSRRGPLPRLYKRDVLTALRGPLVWLSGDETDEELLTDICAVLDIGPGSRMLAAGKRAMAERTGLITVDVCDNAYVTLEDRPLFEVISDAGTKPTPQHLYPVTGADFGFEDYEMPKASIIHAEGDLLKMCRDGITARGMAWDDAYETRLNYEMDLIQSKKFESYFIIVADMVMFAKQHMLVGPSRGSAAGSLVCYLTRITEIDPIKHELFFERFIDVSRSDMPDIELDFQDKKRQMVFDYMAQKHGLLQVAHIGTISTLRAKSALEKAAKKLGVPPTATGATKAAMIERLDADKRFNFCLEDTLKETDAGRQLVHMYPQIAIAAKLEGHSSHSGVHAAGLLVTNDPIERYCTITDKGIAQIDKVSAEKLNLLKIDVLGLRTLSILEDSGIDVDWYNLPLDDPETMRVFKEERLSGVFQFEGEALRDIARKIDIDSITQVDAVTALARPARSLAV